MATTGSTPSPVQKVQFFIHYLKLDDVEYINTHLISGKGKETQGKLNYAANGEDKNIQSEYVHDDHRFRKIAIEARREHRVETPPGRATKPKLVDTHVSNIPRQKLVSPSISGSRHPDREVSIRVICLRLKD